MGIEKAIATLHVDDELRYEEVLDEILEEDMEDDEEVVETADAPLLSKKAQNRMDHARKCRKERNSDTLKHNRRRRVGMRIFPATLVSYNRNKAKKALFVQVRAYEEDADGHPYFGSSWYDPLRVEYFEYLQKEEERRNEERLLNASIQEAALYTMQKDYGSTSYYDHLINGAPSYDNVSV